MSGRSSVLNWVRDNSSGKESTLALSWANVKSKNKKIKYLKKIDDDNFIY